MGHLVWAGNGNVGSSSKQQVEQSGNGHVGMDRTVVYSLVVMVHNLVWAVVAVTVYSGNVGSRNSSSIQYGNGHVGNRTVVYSLVMGMLVAKQQ